MGIPVFISQIIATATDTVQVGAGSVQTIPATQYYFLASNKSTAGNGKSFLQQLDDSLTASGDTWAVGLTSDLKIKLVHGAGGTANIAMNRVLAWNLGFALETATTYPPSSSATTTIAVPGGISGYTAPYRSPWLWCPEMLVSSTGPELFDPMVQAGVVSSTGAMARSPDGTVSSVSQGVQTEAVFLFKGVQYLYRAKPSDPNFTSFNPHEREDCQTWWQHGPNIGRRVLFWRDRDLLTIGESAPPGTSLTALAPAYVEYYPDAATARKPSIVASAPPNLYYWDITLGFTLTERGVALYT